MHVFTNLVAGLAIASVMATFGIPEVPAVQDQAVTLTGCLRSGSDPAIFILRGATGGSDAPSPRDYLLVDVADGVNPGAALNRRVAVTGRIWPAGEGPAAPQAANTAERALRRQSVASMREVASECLEPAIR